MNRLPNYKEAVSRRGGNLYHRGKRLWHGNIQGRDMHFLVDKKERFAYLPIPKVACTSLKVAFLDLENPHLYTKLSKKDNFWIHHHLFCQSIYWKSSDEIHNFRGFRFAVIRDPIDRLSSTYTNRVIVSKDLNLPGTDHRALRRLGLPIFPDIDTFFQNVSAYAKSSRSIAHHVRPQKYYIRDRSLFDKIYRMEDLAELAHDIESHCGVHFNLHEKNKTDFEKPVISRLSREAAFEYYEQDFELFSDIL